MQQEEFGKFIAEIRKEKKLTQKELAQQLFVTDKAVSKWERGASLPDIKLLEPLAEALGISVYELMACERVSQECPQEVSAEMAKKAVHETVVAAEKKQKKTARVSRIIIITLIVLLVVMLLFGTKIANFFLGIISDKIDSPYHTCQLEVEYEHPYVNYYIYEERVKEHEALFCVVGVEEDGTECEIFRLREKGMRLQRAPKVLWDEEYVYVVFEGLDNEDGIERLYGDIVGTDVQGFIPYLYRYCKASGEIEEIKLKGEDNSLLLDAFTHEGETIWISQQFKGLIFGLNLGWYLGADGYCSYGNGIHLANITKEGGMKTTGCYEKGIYYILGQDGIHVLDLFTGQERVIAQDWGMCYRGEIKRITLENGNKGFATVRAMAGNKAIENSGQIRNVTTVVSIYDKDFQELDSREIDCWSYGIEWGEESVLISDQENGLESHLVRFDDLSEEIYHIEDYEWNVIRSSLDELECQKSQWVYVPGMKEYILTQTNRRVLE